MMLVLRESLIKDFTTKTTMYFLYAQFQIKIKLKFKNIYSLNYHRDLFYKNKYHSIKYLNFNISQSQINTLNKKINIVFDEQLILIQKIL